MRPSAPQNTPEHHNRRGFLSRIFSRASAPKTSARRKKVLAGALAFGLVTGGVSLPQSAAAQSAPRGPIPTSIVLDVQNNRVLNERSADTRIHPASTTKLMTIYMVFQAIEDGRLRPDQRLTVSARAAAQPRTNLALRAGTTITVDQALRGLMVHSANDAAVVLGEAVAGSEARFAQQMTTRARALGMSNSSFRNANGLGNPAQYVTARDMSRLMVALFRDFPELSRRYLAVPDFSYNGASWTNTNRLLGSTQCPGIIGGKTGYIRAAGTNLIVMAERNDRRVVVGVFGRASGAARNELTCNLINFAYFKMLRDPGATYEESRTYPVIMPAPIVPATPATDTPPITVNPLPTPLLPPPYGSVPPIAPDMPGQPANPATGLPPIYSLEPRFNSSSWQLRGNVPTVQPLLAPTTTRYSLRFGG